MTVAAICAWVVWETRYLLCAGATAAVGIATDAPWPWIAWATLAWGCAASATVLRD